MTGTSQPGDRRTPSDGGDILVVVVDSTAGWSAGAAELAAALRRAGASVRVAGTGPVPHVRTFALTDLTQAWMARRACSRAIAEREPSAIVYCSMTAALLWPRPGAIWLDCVAAENRPGRHGVWQRQVERRRLAQATVLLPWSEHALDAASLPHAPTVLVPPPVDPRPGEAAAAAGRDIAAVTYAGDPEKRRLPEVIAAWQRARRDGETLVIAGLEGYTAPDGVDSVGRIDRDAFRALLRRARTFLAAPRREEYGIAALEALAEGSMLVTTPSPGPYPALGLAREIDPRLVEADLAPAIRRALDDPLPGYAERAAALLAPFSTESLDRTLAERVIPRLLADSGNTDAT
jgi:hypothetical protein